MVSVGNDWLQDVNFVLLTCVAVIGVPSSVSWELFYSQMSLYDWLVLIA
jgi:hypothetical protein